MLPIFFIKNLRTIFASKYATISFSKNASSPPSHSGTYEHACSI